MKPGLLVEAYEYDTYGRQTVIVDGDANGTIDFNGTDTKTVGGNSTIGNPYMYTGQRFDPETDLNYYKNRYYDTIFGRFISRDPIGYFDGYNLYQYVQSNPTEYIDSFGLSKGSNIDRTPKMPKANKPPNMSSAKWRKYQDRAVKLWAKWLEKLNAQKALSGLKGAPKWLVDRLKAAGKIGGGTATAVVGFVAITNTSHAGQYNIVPVDNSPENCMSFCDGVLHREADIGFFDGLWGGVDMADYRGNARWIVECMLQGMQKWSRLQYRLYLD